MLWLGILALGVASLACGMSKPAAEPVRVSLKRLPTLTPTTTMVQAPLPEAEAPQAGLNPATEVQATGEALPDSDLSALQTATIAAPAEVPSPVIGTPAAGQSLTATPAGSSGAVNGAAVALPTATPSPSATAIAPPPTPTPTVTASPTPALTPTPLPEWLFTGVKAYPDPYGDGRVLYGEVTNNSATAQELYVITGSFFDSQGGIVAGEDQTYAYWPGYVIPAGGRMPFELTVEGVSDLARFDLRVEAEPSSEAPRQDIEFLDVQPQVDGESYCLHGRLRNPGGALQEYLIVAATFYDGQDNVINFGDYQEFGRASLVGDKTSAFEVCVEPGGQVVARHVLQAWAR